RSSCDCEILHMWSCIRKCDLLFFFFFSSRRRHTRFSRDWSSDVCSSDLNVTGASDRGRIRIRSGAGLLCRGKDEVQEVPTGNALLLHLLHPRIPDRPTPDFAETLDLLVGVGDRDETSFAEFRQVFVVARLVRLLQRLVARRLRVKQDLPVFVRQCLPGLSAEDVEAAGGAQSHVRRMPV